MTKTRRRPGIKPTRLPCRQYEVERALKIVRDGLDKQHGDCRDSPCTCEPETTDVRLVVGWPDSSHEGEWTLNEGSADYDQWHGACGDSSVSATDTLTTLTQTAQDLIAQVEEQLAP